MTDAEFAQWLAAENSKRCILVEAQYYDKVTSLGGRTEYLSTHPFISQRGESGGLNDIGYYEFIVPDFSYSLGLNAGVTFSVKMFNNNNEFETWFYEREWVGWPIRFLIGDITWRRTDFRTLYSGVIGEVSYDRPYFEFKVYDYAKKFDIEVERANLKELSLVNNWRRFDNTPLIEVAGTYVAYDPSGNYGPGTLRWTIDPNTNLPIEIEVGALDVSSSLLENPNSACPIGLGNCYNVQPILLDYTDNRYIINPPDIRSNILVVRDKGVPVPFTLEAGLLGALPSGQFRLINQPQGQVTCDFFTSGTFTGLGELPGNSGAYIANIIKTIVYKLKLHIETPQIDDKLGDFIDTTQVGFYSSGGATAKSIIDDITASINGYWGFTRNTELLVFYLDEYNNYPTFTPDYVLLPDNIRVNGVSISEIQNAKAALKLSYFKNHTPTTKDSLEGNVSGEDPVNESHNNIIRDIMAKDYTYEEFTDNQVLVRAPLSEPKHIINTSICSLDKTYYPVTFAPNGVSSPVEYNNYHYTRIINSRSASQIQAHTNGTRIFDLVKVNRYVYTVDVRKLDKLLNLGDTVAIMFDGFNLIETYTDKYVPANNNIKVGLILRIDEVPASGSMRLTVWL